MTEAPLAMTVNRTNPSGMITSTNASTISAVAMRSVARRRPAGLSQVGLLMLGGDSHQAPLCRRADRSTTRAGNDVNDDREGEQEHAEPHQRGAVQARWPRRTRSR